MKYSNSKIEKYLTKNIDDKYSVAPCKGQQLFSQVVVIPVFNEMEYIQKTLDSIFENSATVLSETLILLVVNNSEEIDKNAKPYLDNQTLLFCLREKSFIFGKNHSINLKWIDAASPGFGFLGNSGVGPARKLGMDIALTMVDWNKDPLIICLDADTIVETDYLLEIRKHFNNSPEIPAAVVSFKHIRTGNKENDQAIDDYEFFLQYYVDKLSWAGSPYGYHAIGSTIVARAGAYVQSGGMRATKAGEDFYFLQALRKLGEITEISGTKVYQSSRPSDRVPFGTGATMIKSLSGIEIKVYNPEIFEVIKVFLSEIKHWIMFEHIGDTTELEKTIPPEAKLFLDKYHFDKIWPKILENNIKNNVKIIETEPRKKLLWCFNIWFDAFKTLKFVHFLEMEYSDRFPKVRISDLLKK